MAKDNAELQALPQPQSRNEKYLNYLAGRAVDLNLLPDPQSRVEEYLQYLCYNRGQGGGGGQPLDTSFIGATIQNNIITFQRQDGTTHDVNLEDIIPNATKESIKEITVVGKELVLTKVDNSELRVDLTQLLSAINISFNNANSGLTSDNVQGAIDELNGKFIEDITYDEARNRTIFKTKGGQQDIAVVEGLVTRWKHLEHVTESNNFNIFNPTTFIEGRYYGVNGVVVYDFNWGHFNIPCSGGETFTVFKKRYDSKNFGLLENDTWIENLAVNSTNDGIWKKFLINIPHNPRVTHLSIPVYKVDNDYRNEVMVFRGNVQAPAEFIPFTNNREISIDGEKVNISFDASTTTLSTNSVVDAIKELDVKVANASTGIVTSVNGIQPVNGNVTITSSDIDYDNQTSQLASNNVKDAIDEVKNLINLLQAKNATTHFVADNTEFEQLKNTTTFVSGDIVYVINSNGVVDYTNTDVDNDGKAISLIYDEKVTGFRVLSRDSEKINLKASSVTVEPTINGLNNVQDVLDYLEKDKASLNKNNVFIGYNTFNEVNLLGKTPFVETIGNIQGTGHKNNVYCGNREVSTHKNTPPQGKQYVSALKIRILNSVNIGDTVSGICVAEVEKITNRVDDIVRKTIVSNGTFIVEEDANYDKCIYVPVQKEYSNDTYFLIGQKGAKSDLREYHLNNPSQCINGLDIDSLPTEGSQLNHNNGSGWLIIHSLLTNDINVRDELDSLKNKVSSAVISVNGQNPNTQGAVTVNAEHIGYNGNTSNIIATNVQEAIDELKRDVNLVNGATIYIVRDNTELSNLLNRNVVRHGDLIYIINSTGVVDFDNQPANGGNPVAMIFDNNLTTGNKLRVFSKFSTTAHILAKNVEYDDQTTNLQANNVQGAIGKLNEKIANAGTVKSVNSVTPQVDGDVVLRGENINVEVLFTPGTVQSHLEEIKTLAQTAQNEAQTALLRADTAFNSYNRLNPIVNSNANEITALKRRSQYRVGDVITTFRQSNNNYTINNVEFIYLGRANNTVSATTYPDLATAFGIQSSAANFTLPQIQDIERFFDVNRRTYQKHFIVAKIN